MTPPADPGPPPAEGLRPLRHLLPYYRKYAAAYLFGVSALIAAVVLRLFVPQRLGVAIEDLRQAADDTAAAEPERLRALLLSSVLFILGIAVVGALTRVWSRWSILGTSRRVVHDLREQLFEHLTRLAPSFYLRTSTGQILSRSMNDMNNVQGLTGPVFLYIAETGLLFGVGIAMMAAISPVLTFWTLLPFPFFILRARTLAKRIQEGARAAQDSLGFMSDKVAESLGGAQVIKTLGLEAVDRGRFERHAGEYRALNLEVTRARTKLMPAMMLLTALAQLLALAIGLPMAQQGTIPVGQFISFLIFVQMLAGPTATLGFVISSLQRGAAAVARIQELVDSEITLPESPGLESPQRLDGTLEVRNLSVVRPAPPGEGGGPRRVLRDVSFELPAGGTLGIVGHTGSGKSTLVAALARQIEVPENTLLYGGRCATELSPRGVRRHIGLVPQDPFLFSATLAENVALGRPDASPLEIDEAVRIAQLAKDLGQLPEGLETTVGERGVNLSGGQRQRTALARAVLMRPDLLLLDDTLSAVDTETAEAILSELEPIMASRSTVIVAHRLSTVRHAQRILVLEEGALVESGTHDELLAAAGVYADLWSSQAEESRGRTTSDSEQETAR